MTAEMRAAVDPTGGSLRVPAGKTVVPELPIEFTARPRLRARLDEAVAGQLVVVIAPAGSGKTLLLADWARNSGGPETAWVSLDTDDNDPRRFWSAIATALLALPSATQDARGQQLTAIESLPLDADLAEAVADTLESLDPPVRLVLDVVHELTGHEVLRDLTRLIRRNPAGTQIVLASRSDPPISIPRLRLEGRLHEIRADVLRFSVEETTTLLRAASLELSPSQVAVLHSRTEGWAAGLRLAALALRRTDDPARFLRDFSGDENSVAEYLTGEILDGLTPETRDFLRVVSVCSPLPAELATDLAGRPDAERVLDDLRQETPLIERTAPGSYRIQALLRSYLVADLARSRPHDYRELQAEAARFWFHAGEPVHALRHAERAGDGELITRLVRGSGVVLLLGGDLGPLRRALAAVGADARRTDPWLALTAAITHLDARALPTAAAELENARRAWPRTPDADLESLRTSAVLLAAGLGLAVVPFGTPGDDAEPPGGESEPTEPEVAALLHASRAAAEFGNPAGTDVARARAELAQALDLARAHDLGYLEVQSLTMLATLDAIRGDLRPMAATAGEAVAAATRHGRHPSAWSAAAMGMIAYADLLAGRPAAATARAEEVLGTWDPLPPEAAYTLHAVHGAAVADQGRRPAGLAEVQAARAEFGNTPATPQMIAGLALLEHRIAVLNGNPRAAAEVADSLDQAVGTRSETLLVKAWTEMAAGRYDLARALVPRMLEPEMPLLLLTRVEAHLLEAEAALQGGEEEAGRAALEVALAEGEAMGVARPFALAGPCTQELLTARARLNGRGRFSAQVTEARAAVVPDVAVPLSEREMAVMALLPSLLSAREIAGEFTVSVNTVKSHIRSIYAKLGVSTRREAVRRAQERGLVP